MKAMLLKLLGARGVWVYLIQVILEMIGAQDDLTPVPGGASAGSLKLQRVLDRLKKALSSVFGLDVYWTAIRIAATEAIAANKRFYTVLTDAFNAIKAAK